MKTYRKSFLCLLILTLVLTMMPMSSFADKVYADAIWYNGRIVTLDKASHVYQAIAVKDDKILAVGSVNSIKAYANQATKQYDLKGKTVIPGMIDTHLHFMRYGLTFLQIGCTDKSKEWILDQVKKMADGTEDSLWVRGSGWNQMIWSNPVFPAAADLDAVSGGNPVILTRSDNHTLWVNSKVLELAGITKDTPDPAGGTIVRDASGNPTGILIDTAMNLVNSVVPAWSKQEIEKAYITADQMYSKVGLTTVHDAGDKVDLDILKNLISEGKIKTRVYAVLDKTTVTPRLEKGEKPEIGLYNNHLTIRSMKLKSDGALGSRGAYMLSDYSDAPGVTGNCLIPKEELKQYCRKALELGYQVDVHAIGDKANREALNAFEEVFKEKNIVGNPNRFSIVHAQVIAMSDIPRFGKLQIPALIQPVHATGDMNMAETRLGPWRILGAYAYRALEDQGIVLAGGSDSPNDYIEPIYGIHAAIKRTDRNNLPAGGWYPAQSLSRREALDLYTVNAAWAGFEENLKGTLEAGKLADMVVLSDDISTMPAKDIWKCEPVNTIIGGKIVYTAE